jgi:hypothetical protein
MTINKKMPRIILYLILVLISSILSSCNDFGDMSVSYKAPPAVSGSRGYSYPGERVTLPSGHKLRMTYGQVADQQTLSNGWKVGAIVTY